MSNSRELVSNIEQIDPDVEEDKVMTEKEIFLNELSIETEMERRLEMVLLNAQLTD